MAAHIAAPAHDIAGDTPSLPAMPGGGFAALVWRLETKLFNHIQARREARVTEFIESNGGELTDELEREISRRFGNMMP